MKQVIFIALGFAGLALAACKKDDNGKKATAVQLITSATWKFDTATLDLTGDGNPDTGLPEGFLESCDKDNTITFKSDMTGIADEGATKCEDTLPQSTNFTWSLTNNDSTLNVVGSSNALLNGSIRIKGLTNTNFILAKDTSVNLGFGANIDATVIVTLKK